MKKKPTVPGMKIVAYIYETGISVSYFHLLQCFCSDPSFHKLDGYLDYLGLVDKKDLC